MATRQLFYILFVVLLSSAPLFAESEKETSPVLPDIHAVPDDVLIINGSEDPFAIAEWYFSDPNAHILDPITLRWFNNNRYHHADFHRVDELVRLKKEQGIRISMVLPTLREEDTIGKVISKLKRVAKGKNRLVDEIVVIDSGSDDKTLEVAKQVGGDYVRVRLSADILDEQGTFRGKGENLWKALYETDGDILLFLDADIDNITPHYVYGLLGPLLYRPEIGYVKGFYMRPIKNTETKEVLSLDDGGRTTEIMGRPNILNGGWPALSGIIAPYSGEFAMRRSIMEQLPIPVGYGVETANLIDVYQLWGLQAIAQVDLTARFHNNQKTVDLGKMSKGIRQTMLRRELWYLKGIRFHRESNEYITYETVKRPDNPRANFGELEEYQFKMVKHIIDDTERPPMISVKAYRDKFGARTSVAQQILPCSVNLAMHSAFAGMVGRPFGPWVDETPRVIPQGSMVAPKEIPTPVWPRDDD